jgi:3-dehydroshikimate dehydratase
MEIRTGLVSVTFRALAPDRIVALVSRAGLEAIEWGGDVHVPHGEVATARAVRHITLGAGLQLPSYGSYYRVGSEESVSFEKVLETAVALGTPVIRVWAGTQGSDQADGDTWGRVIDDSYRIADLAQAAGLRIAYEYHGNTLTDTDAATQRLLDAVDHAAVGTYWQLREGVARDEQLAGLRAVLPRLAHVHVQASQGGARAPLAAMATEWQAILRLVASTGRSHCAMIEFVKGDSPERFLEDAAVLRELTSDE